MTSNTSRPVPVARKTWVIVENKRIDLQSYYDEFAVVAVVSYRTYWQRVRSLRLRGLLDGISLDHAIVLDQADWITFYGGGRKRGFTYYGEQHPELVGHSFPSVTALLRTINRYDDRSLIWARLKGGWSLEVALTIPGEISSWRPGLIYKIVRISTGQVYVGLTVTGLDQRWVFHLRAAKRGATTKLATAIREDGDAGFHRVVLEGGITNPEELKDREVYWVTELDALGSNGLNVAPPGGLGSPRGKTIIVNGVSFRSQSEAADVIGSERGLAQHVVLRSLNHGLPIPDRARKNSKHPDAGSNLFRRWLALARRHPDAIDPIWRDNYDRFKADVRFNDPTLSLTRLNDTQPWGPSNFQWLTTVESVERTHGKVVVVQGTIFPSLKAVALHFNIGCSTLKDRVFRQGLSFDEAVATPAGRTSYRRLSDQARVDGKEFRSKRQAVFYLIREKGLTEHAARMRFKKSIDLTK